MKKRLLSTRLILCMVMILMSGTTWAADAETSGTCGENLTWSYNNGTLTIQSTGSMDGYVHYSPPWDDYREQIHTVIIGSGVTGIGFQAFYGRERLTSINIPDSVVGIGVGAFHDCSSLTSGLLRLKIV